MLRDSLGEYCRIESGISAMTVAPNIEVTGFDKGRPAEVSSGLRSVPPLLPKWLFIKARKVMTSRTLS